MKKKENENEWVICPECKTKLKHENLSRHMKLVHDKIIDETDVELVKPLPKKGQKQKTSGFLSKGTIIVVIVIVVVVIVSMFFLFSASPGNSNNDDGNNGDDGHNSNGISWLNDYTPVHSVGTGSDDFWIEFPAGSDNYGQPIQHFDWVTNTIDNNCVLFVVHITGCVGCQAQADRVIALAEKYSENVEFYDIDAVDSATEEIKQMANAAYFYDPDGSPGYIALTGVFTYVEDNGEIKIGWHSWELDVEDSVMEDWIKDGIYYYYLNSEG